MKKILWAAKQRVSSPIRGAIIGGVAVFATLALVCYGYGMDLAFFALLITASAGVILLVCSWLSMKEPAQESPADDAAGEPQGGTN